MNRFLWAKRKLVWHTEPAPGGIDLLVRYNYALRLHEGYWFRKHVRDLPGKPEIVFVKARLVVFLDGDLWHGYRFPQWEKTVAKSWRKKIGETRKRDQRNFAKLRRMCWRVIRIWEHSVKRDLDGVVRRICAELRSK